MNSLKNLYLKYYYRIRIIVTFTGVTALLAAVFAFTGYRFVRELYLDQLSEKVNTVSGLISSQISRAYINFLQIGPPTVSTREYFEELFRRNGAAKGDFGIFIFDGEFKIIIHSDTTMQTGYTDSRLLLNKNEIMSLKLNESTASLPFKGEDGRWYLWGFNRLDNGYWLGIRESAGRMEKIDGLSQLFLLLGLGGVLLSFILSWFIAKSISGPVDKLVEYSSAIGSGNFSVPEPPGMQGEIKALSSAMDKMKHDLSANQKERENMLAQIAHEIRNPLGGIELLASLTKEDLVKQNIEAGYIDKILGEVNGLKKLITSFLEFSRPLPAHPAECDVKKFTDEILENLAPRIGEKNISVICRNDSGKIYFDPGHFKQLMMNLISNSIQFSEKGGKISVLFSHSNGVYNISVSDEGPGIPDENLEKIFEPFFTTRKTGTGLGLAVCKKLCSENKASLTVRNNSESGCTFTITGEYDNA